MGDGTKIQNLPTWTENLEDPTRTENLMLIENLYIKIGIVDLEQVTKILELGNTNQISDLEYSVADS